MNEKIKKILIIIAFLGFISLISYFLWRLFFKQEAILFNQVEEIDDTLVFEGLPSANEGDRQATNSTDDPMTNGEDNTLENDKTQAPVAPINQEANQTIAIGDLNQARTIVESNAVSPFLNKSNGDVNFYNSNTGIFYKINSSGEIEPINSQILKNVKNVEWSPNTEMAILEFNDGSKSIYDFDKNKKISIPNHFENLKFSDNGDKIVGISNSQNPDNKWLIISRNDGSEVKQISNIGESTTSIIPSWSPNNQFVAMKTNSIGIDKQEIIFIGEYGQNFPSITVEGQNFQAKWSKDGDRLLYSVNSLKNDSKPELWINNIGNNLSGASRQNIKVETWAEKCTFASNNEIYCAVPKNISAGTTNPSQSLMPISDEIYKINLNTGQKTLIASPKTDQNIKSLIITEDESSIFFINTQGTISNIKIN